MCLCPYQIRVDLTKIASPGGPDSHYNPNQGQAAGEAVEPHIVHKNQFGKRDSQSLNIMNIQTFNQSETIIFNEINHTIIYFKTGVEYFSVSNGHVTKLCHLAPLRPCGSFRSLTLKVKRWEE